MGRIRAEEQAAAKEQQLAVQLWEENRAAIVVYLLAECIHIVALRKTFVNEENTTSYRRLFSIFCAEHTKQPFPSKKRTETGHGFGAVEIIFRP